MATNLVAKMGQNYHPLHLSLCQSMQNGMGYRLANTRVYSSTNCCISCKKEKCCVWCIDYVYRVLHTVYWQLLDNHRCAASGNINRSLDACRMHWRIDRRCINHKLVDVTVLYNCDACEVTEASFMSALCINIVVEMWSAHGVQNTASASANFSYMHAGKVHIRVGRLYCSLLIN